MKGMAMETIGRKKSKNVWKVIAIALIIFVVAALALKGCGQALSKIPSVPGDYTQKVKTGGEIEAEYLAMGSHEVEHLESVVAPLPLRSGQPPSTPPTTRI